MLRALLERGIVPDVVLGTSIGAINGAAVAAEPSPRAVQRLAESWSQFEGRDVFGGSALRRLGTLARSRTHLHDTSHLRGLLADALPVQRIEELAVPFACVAACIETPRSAGSPTARSSTPSSRRVRCRGCCRPCASARSTSSTAAS
jgi:NTE family protein